jgi:hypothetical protein
MFKSVNRFNTKSSTEGDIMNNVKALVRDYLISIKFEERAEFIRSLEAEMSREKLSIRAYLIPLGIPGITAEDLSPTDVGHLVRYLQTSVPRSIPAIERVLLQYHLTKADDGLLAA